MPVATHLPGQALRAGSSTACSTLLGFGGSPQKKKKMWFYGASQGGGSTHSLSAGRPSSFRELYYIFQSGKYKALTVCQSTPGLILLIFIF